MGSCHVTQNEQKKKHGKFFWLNFLKNPLLRCNTQANVHVPYIRLRFDPKSEFLISKKNIGKLCYEPYKDKLSI